MLFTHEIVSIMYHAYEGHQSVSKGNSGEISTYIFCNKAIKHANKLYFMHHKISISFVLNTALTVFLIYLFSGMFAVFIIEAI